MRISTDDPKLTAYALDEMNERQRLEFEQQLTISPDLRAAVSEIRQMAVLLRHEFVAEREAFCGDTFPTQKIVAFSRRRMWSAAGTVAAGFALVLVWQFWFQGSRKPEPSFPGRTVREASVDFRPDFDNLKHPAFDDVANMAYGSAEIGRTLMADLGTGLSLGAPHFRSSPSENAQFQFGIGYQLEF